MKRPIAISLSPNTQRDDVLLALRLFLSPWLYIRGNCVRLLEQWFRNFFGVSYAVSFNSGRVALAGILQSAGLKAGDEVILQSFTCVVVPNAILTVGAKPVYVDIAKDLSMDIRDLEKKITSKTKAILVQHTFGIPTDMTRVNALASKHKLLVIEDCAHVLGGEYKDKKLGLWGDVAFFSFGRDKAFSSVFGGMAITNDKIIGKKLRQFQKKKESPSYFWVAQQLIHPIAFALIVPLYNFWFFGKALLVLLQRLHLLSFPVTQEEKHAHVEKNSGKRLPNALACLALAQVKKVKPYNEKREKIVAQYIQELDQTHYILPYKNSRSLLRFPVLVDDRDTLLQFFKKRGVYLGKWYSEIIDPYGSDYKKVYYKKGSCPVAEEVAQKIINLPTYPTMSLSDARRIITLLSFYARNSRNN